MPFSSTHEAVPVLDSQYLYKGAPGTGKTTATTLFVAYLLGKETTVNFQRGDDAVTLDPKTGDATWFDYRKAANAEAWRAHLRSEDAAEQWYFFDHLERAQCREPEMSSCTIVFTCSNDAANYEKYVSQLDVMNIQMLTHPLPSKEECKQAWERKFGHDSNDVFEERFFLVGPSLRLLVEQKEFLYPDNSTLIAYLDLASLSVETLEKLFSAEPTKTKSRKLHEDCGRNPLDVYTATKVLASDYIVNHVSRNFRKSGDLLAKVRDVSM